jgi:Helix-turn-helix domain
VALKSEKQAAEYLGLDLKTLRNHRCQGCGPPFIKFPSGAVRYDEETLVSFVKANTFTSTTEAQAARLERQKRSA